jgi:hypothetical protein
MFSLSIVFSLMEFFLPACCGPHIDYEHTASTRFHRSITDGLWLPLVASRDSGAEQNRQSTEGPTGVYEASWSELLRRPSGPPR